MDVFPDLTIATTIHNNLDRWMEMATSFEREAGQPVEMVAVDDASRTPAVISGLSTPVRLLRNEKARGFGGASDQALKEVRTPYALLIDADITFLPGDFRAAFEAFKALPKLAWSNFEQVSAGGGRARSCDEVLPPGWVYGLGNKVESRWLQRWSQTHRSPMLSERIMQVPISHSSSCFVRMEAFRQIDGFDPRFWQCESDNDVCLRLGRAGWQVGVDQNYALRHDGIGGRTGGRSRVYDLYRGKLLIYETHRPGSGLYLRPLLALRHTLEALFLTVRRRPDENLQPGFRWHLAQSALRGYPPEKR